MQLKHFVLIFIVVAYSGYYVAVSKGYYKKETRYGNEDGTRSAVQMLIDVITPDNPEEKRLRGQDELDELYIQLDLAKKNYQSYVDWRTNAISNPPE
jgi:hypothetical protein